MDKIPVVFIWTVKGGSGIFDQMRRSFEGFLIGEFEGLAGGKTYRLSDGSRWVQACNTAESVYRMQPRARLIWDPTQLRWTLDIEGTSWTVWVKPERTGLSQSGNPAW